MVKVITEKSKGGRPRGPRVDGFAGLVGGHLEQLASRAGLTAQSLSDRLGITSQSVLAYFRGHKLPLLRDLPALAIALKVSPRDLIPEIKKTSRKRA